MIPIRNVLAIIKLVFIVGIPSGRYGKALLRDVNPSNLADTSRKQRMGVCNPTSDVDDIGAGCGRMNCVHEFDEVICLYASEEVDFESSKSQSPIYIITVIFA